MEITQEFSQKIYKKDSKGKIRILHVYTEGADLIQESGIIDGALVEHRSTCVAKNIGKANETTPEEQARAEAKSKIETKMSTGYFDTVEEAESEEVILPMLAKSFDNEKHKVVYPCYGQPKLDGMRALGGSNIISRKGKVIDTMAHIQADIDSIPVKDLLDGELYAHGHTFQENMKAIKKIRSVAEDGIPASTDVKYHVYDMVLSNTSFIYRYTLLNNLVKNCPNIEIVPTAIINNEDELKAYHQENLAKGYEGTIIRHSDAGYAVNKRDTQLLKYKDFIDIACKVVDIKPCKKRPEQGECVCEGYAFNDPDQGVVKFGTGMKFSHKEREEILANKENYIGQTAEIRFFEYTDDGVPRFPVCVGFRLDK